jgi:putative DNA primase/helicase
MSTETLKAVISGDPITASRKYEKECCFDPTAAHLFAGNELPAHGDQSEGFWRRIVLLQFNNTFDENADTTQRELWKEIVDSELPHIVHSGIQGALRLLKNEGYTIPPSSNEIKRRWRKETDSVAAFVRECCEVVDEPAAPTSELYFIYNSWCRQSGRRIVAKNTFGERLKKLGYPSTRKSINGTQLRRPPLKLLPVEELPRRVGYDEQALPDEAYLDKDD